MCVCVKEREMGHFGEEEGIIVITPKFIGIFIRVHVFFLKKSSYFLPKYFKGCIVAVTE